MDEGVYAVKEHRTARNKDETDKSKERGIVGKVYMWGNINKSVISAVFEEFKNVPCNAAKLL